MELASISRTTGLPHLVGASEPVTTRAHIKKEEGELRLFVYDDGDEILLETEDFGNNEYTEMALTKGEALAVGLALVNWAGGM